MKHRFTPPRHRWRMARSPLENVRASGILHAEIHLRGTRMVMVLDVDDDVAFEAKAAVDAANPVVQRWETLMWRYQEALPGTPAGEKWQLMERIGSSGRTRGSRREQLSCGPRLREREPRYRASRPQAPSVAGDTSNRYSPCRACSSNMSDVTGNDPRRPRDPTTWLIHNSK